MRAIRWTAAATIVSAMALAGSPCLAAGKATSQMRVQVTVPAGCQVTTRPLQFGSVAILSGAVDATTTISLRCAPGTAYSIGLDNGLHETGSQRRMYADGVGFAGLRYVNYNLYRNAARTLVWGSTLGQTVSGTAPANGRVDVTVFGRMPAAIVLPTDYQDTVTVTVTF